MFKTIFAILLLGLFSIEVTFISDAGTWEKDREGWFWENGDGTYACNEWRWLDGNKDGIAECYYFDSEGYCMTDTITPDGYQVDSNGAWIVNGIAQTKSCLKESVLTSYTNEELTSMAINYYEERFSCRPQFVDIEDLGEGVVILHLYDYVVDHTATYDWYTIDRNTAKGTNFWGEYVDLTSF